MIEHAAPHNSPTNNDDPAVRFHCSILICLPHLALFRSDSQSLLRHNLSESISPLSSLRFAQGFEIGNLIGN